MEYYSTIKKNEILQFARMWMDPESIMLCEISKTENQRPNCQHPLDHPKSKRVPEKHLSLLY